MKNEFVAAEIWLRNQAKKRKNIQDQQIIDEMLAALKKKHEAQKQQQINELTEKLKRVRV
ncbi:MAG: hypothetical protein WC089_03670 [Candidatus Paceibacterota bacterium]